MVNKWFDFSVLLSSHCGHNDITVACYYCYVHISMRMLYFCSFLHHGVGVDKTYTQAKPKMLTLINLITSKFCM